MSVFGNLVSWAPLGLPAWLFVITIVVFFHELGHFAMARLFGWDELACGPSGELFVAQWSMPASERSGRGDAD